MPVILRSCAWKYTPLAKIQAYPEKAKPVVSWTYIDEAYTNVVEGVYLAATKIKERRSQPQAEQERIQQERQPADQPKPLPDALRGDYAHLETLLKAGKWKEADQETAKQMCQVMGRQNEGWLRIEDIEQFPCADLREIDQLWVKNSNGKFGFSVQKKIWDECGSPTEYNSQNQFGKLVGWDKVSAWWDDFKGLIFDTSAPSGHLPIVRIFGDHWGFNGGGEAWVMNAPTIFSRVNTCRLWCDSLGNYAQLEALLKAGKWKEADEETVKQMYQSMPHRLGCTDIENFPCADLCTIDQLWVKHSNGKFGFSVQKKIWQQCGSPTEYHKQWDKFREAVGWLTKAKEVNYEDLTFDTSAPEGHLPRGNCGCNMGLCLFGGINLFPRVKMCEL